MACGSYQFDENIFWTCHMTVCDTARDQCLMSNLAVILTLNFPLPLNPSICTCSV